MPIRDERLQRLRRVLESRPPAMMPQAEGMREAAVALVLRPSADLELLLIRRAERTGDPWSGHMALPGGTRQPSDASLVATAFRETEEETDVALAREGVLLGGLDPVRPMTHRLPDIAIAPFVAMVPAGTNAVADAREVVAAFWAPLALLRHADAAGELHLALDTETRTFPTLLFEGNEIWGLTHRILVDFFRVLEEAGL
jgi:8-oxo-dGTP pyrophosphatase MutT (NUDIX family)